MAGKRSVASVAVYVVALGLNLVWEFLHVRLYTTKVSNVYLVWQSIKDALWVTIAFLLAPNVYLLALGLLVFAYVVELHAVYTKRWEYGPQMPRVLGVGLSPLLELPVTGALTLFLVGL